MRYDTHLTGKLAGGWIVLLAIGSPLGAADLTLVVKDVPTPGLIWCKPDKTLDPQAAYMLVDGTAAVPAQADEEGRLWWYQPTACAADGCTYSLKTQEAAGGGGVRVEEAEDGVINVSVDGRPFTAFNFGKNLPRPFLYPVHGPSGATVTRHYPMKNVDFEPEKRRDHPHHRSLWTAHGDVRTTEFDKPGTDYWAEGRGRGLQKVTRVRRAAGGPVFGVIEADIDWTTADGKKQFTETRTYRFYTTGAGQRIIDVETILKFTEGDVTFGDTKEGGLLSIRVATSMDEQTGGHMVNARGAKGEKQCWGKPAEWCDYVGPVEGQAVGIAVMDAATNPRHPVSWHIRAYGLYTANPFGLKAFGQQKDGSFSWKKSETAEFNYRVLIHRGDTESARIADHYRLYTRPASVSLR